MAYKVKTIIFFVVKLLTIHTIFVLLLCMMLRMYEEFSSVDKEWLSAEEIKWVLNRRGVRHNDSEDMDVLLEQLRLAGEPIGIGIPGDDTIHCHTAESCEEFVLNDYRKVWLLRVARKGFKPTETNSWEYLVNLARRIGARTATAECRTEYEHRFCRYTSPEHYTLLLTHGPKVHKCMDTLENQVLLWVYSTIAKIDFVEINKDILLYDDPAIVMFAKARIPPLFYRLLSIAYKGWVRFSYVNSNTERGSALLKTYNISGNVPIYFVRTISGNYSYGLRLGEHTNYAELDNFLSVLCEPYAKAKYMYWYMVVLINIVLLFIYIAGQTDITRIIIMLNIGLIGLIYVLLPFIQKVSSIDLVDTYLVWLVFKAKTSYIGLVLQYIWLQFMSRNIVASGLCYFGYMYGIGKLTCIWPSEGFVIEDSGMSELRKLVFREMHIPKNHIENTINDELIPYVPNHMYTYDESESREQDSDESENDEQDSDESESDE